MRVLVCGSRTFEDDQIVTTVLEGFYSEQMMTVVIDGACPTGADEFASRFTGVAHERYPADWETHGKAAGPIRNQQMLDASKPEVVLAFVDKPLGESRGTADMVRRAKEAGVPTYVIEKVR